MQPNAAEVAGGKVSPKGASRRPAGGGLPLTVRDGTGEPAELGSGITFFTGVEKIGLKITREKRPMPLVGGSDRPAPTEN
jgi:hypothetical protein